MTFYQKGVGRPTKVEQVVIDAIYREAERKGISVSELPMCHDLDELSELLRMIKMEGIQTDNTSDEQLFTEESRQHDTSFPNEYTEQMEDGEFDLPHEEHMPDETHDENETLTESEVTLGPLGDTREDTTQMTDEEPTRTDNEFHGSIVDAKGSDPGFITSDYDPFSDPVIERNYTDQSKAFELEDELDEDLHEDKGQTPLDDLPPQAKRRAAEQTAKAILKGYAQVAPIPFKWLAKIPEDKVERMAFDGEIDTSLEVSEGMTFDDYMRETNEQLDELFEVDEATLDDIREPLIDVLMEQQLELTPTQRLVMAVVSHLGQMLSIALKLRKQNNRILAYQQHITHLTRTRAA